jgi:DNA topoisomerase VI subunit B
LATEILTKALHTIGTKSAKHILHNSLSDPLLFFAHLLSKHKKETKPTQHTLVQFPKGTLLSPKQNPLVPIDEKN